MSGRVPRASSAPFPPAHPRFDLSGAGAHALAATAVLISAITAPLIAAWFLRRHGALSNPDEDGLDERGEPLPAAAGAGVHAAAEPGQGRDEDLDPATGRR